MVEKQALGKGLAALLGDQRKPGAPATAGLPTPRQQAAGERKSATGDVQWVPVADIHPNPSQPREHFDEDALQELAASITRDGLLQPVLVRDDDGQFVLIAGERRWRAAQMAGIKDIPVCVRQLSTPADSLRLSLIENIQRRDLNPLEEARAYTDLMQRCGLTQEQLAGEVCRSRSTVANILRLLNLAQPVQEMVSDGRLSMGHARALLGASSQAIQLKLAQRAADNDLSVREVENLVRAAAPRGASERPASHRLDKDPYYVSLEAKLRTALGTKVTIHPQSPTKGRIVIEYYSGEEAEGIFQRLGVGPDSMP